MEGWPRDQGASPGKGTPVRKVKIKIIKGKGEV